jgi:hypothetical protein
MTTAAAPMEVLSIDDLEHPSEPAGTVYAVESPELPGKGPAAAIFRC